jgi:hypothetical protein
VKLKELIAIVDDAYPDGLVGQWFDEPEGHHGDTLAKVIAIELKETFEPKATSGEQIAEAIRVMSVAWRKLDYVIEALEKAEVK